MLITTEIPGVNLRRWQAGDRAALLVNANNRSVWRNLTHAFPHPYTEADADFWLDFSNQDSESLHLTIEANGTSIGGVGIAAGEGVFSRTGELGYWVAETHWGRGVATAAAKAMLQHAKANLHFARLEAAVFGWNPVSMRVLEKVGFEKEAVLRRSVYKDGQLADRVMYAYLVDA
jgi:[ribosomal protein S5]-alanine N-acetyltransferase